MSDVIIVEKMDRWIKITLNRPERLNALNVEMHLAFRAALEAVGNARAVLITWCGTRLLRWPRSRRAKSG
jgi:2-(1,2-epoxy-1,2-dihydrophenyl)acetyl-CoA isomerase